MKYLTLYVRALIDASHGGNVNAAANDIGMPQQTLEKIASGNTSTPRRKALSSIASFYGLTVEALGGCERCTSLLTARLAGTRNRLARIEKEADNLRAEIEQIQRAGE